MAISLLLKVQQKAPGAIIVGGFLRDYESGISPKDLDIAVPFSKELADALNERLDWAVDVPSGYMMSPEVYGVWSTVHYGFPVQVIMLSEGMPPVERVKLHDFGICQIWNDGYHTHGTDAYHEDRQKKRFTLTHCENKKEFERSLRRWERLKQKYPGWSMVVPQRYAGFAVEVMQ